MLPERTSILIVGAGPAGLACAISLLDQGCKDLIIVDALFRGQNSSRAISVHAATLEVLDTIGCAKSMVNLGTKTTLWSMRDRQSEYLSADLSCLSSYTQYPYGLILPQNVTESVLVQRLQDFGVEIQRPYRAAGMTLGKLDPNKIDVCFENGEIIQASYVIGADGARSTVRQLAGIKFNDITSKAKEDLTQTVLADVLLTPAPDPPIPTDEVIGVACPHGFTLFVPLPSTTLFDTETKEDFPEQTIYRLGCPVPHSDEASRNPTTEYLQDLVDKYGPVSLSSDPRVNPHPVRISKILWSSRFRTNSAIAEQFFRRLQPRHENSVTSGQAQIGGIVFLIGDAAHIHSPAGGQGMNLGIRDGIGLGPLIAAHLKRSQSGSQSRGDLDTPLRDYAASRHARALSIISMAALIDGLGNVTGPNMGARMKYWTLKYLGGIPVLRKMMAWRLSGLGAR